MSFDILVRNKTFLIIWKDIPVTAFFAQMGFSLGPEFENQEVALLNELKNLLFVLIFCRLGNGHFLKVEAPH